VDEYWDAVEGSKMTITRVLLAQLKCRRGLLLGLRVRALGIRGERMPSTGKEASGPEIGGKHNLRETKDSCEPPGILRGFERLARQRGGTLACASGGGPRATRPAKPQQGQTWPEASATAQPSKRRTKANLAPQAATSHTTARPATAKNHPRYNPRMRHWLSRPTGPRNLGGGP